MQPMEQAINYVKGFRGRPVMGTDIVSHFNSTLGLSHHCTAGSVGSAVKFGKLTVVGRTRINGKTVNLFV